MDEVAAGNRRAGPVILIVDDDDYVHSTLAAAMRVFRPTLIRASTAAEGLALARSRLPDLAILDVGLPDASGYDLARALRGTPGLATLRICILTGHDPDEDQARAAGADAIIGKPFRLGPLLDLIGGLLPDGASRP